MKGLKGVMGKPIEPPDKDAEIESYRIQVRLSKKRYDQLLEVAETECASMSVLGSIAIGDWLDKREAEKKKL